MIIDKKRKIVYIGMPVSLDRIQHELGEDYEVSDFMIVPELIAHHPNLEGYYIDPTKVVYERMLFSKVRYN